MDTFLNSLLTGFAAITAQDLYAVAILIFMEGVLSLDNALAIAMIARTLPEKQRQKALLYGIWGAWIFRGISLFIINWLMGNPWIKLAGGAYLLYMAYKHFVKGDDDKKKVNVRPFHFWVAVLQIEITDISFSADSILAASGVSDKYWVIFVGGVIGIFMMRLAAKVFIKLLQLFPAFETTAYLLILWIGLKLTIEGFGFSGVNFHDSGSVWSVSFWSLMVASIIYGFFARKGDENENVHDGCGGDDRPAA